VGGITIEIHGKFVVAMIQSSKMMAVYLKHLLSVHDTCILVYVCVYMCMPVNAWKSEVDIRCPYGRCLLLLNILGFFFF
jgi:NAD-dependent dihydropyrimidine dehydrogenase PreA subunit